MSPQSLIISRLLWEKMRHHVSSTIPEEACGLLAGINDQVTLILPVINALHSNASYRMDPQEQLANFLIIENQNLELLGIYHSHPLGPPYPSEKDIAEAYYPDTPYLIWAVDQNGWVCQAFEIKNHEVKSIPITVKDET